MFDIWLVMFDKSSDRQSGPRQSQKDRQQVAILCDNKVGYFLMFENLFSSCTYQWSDFSSTL